MNAKTRWGFAALLSLLACGADENTDPLQTGIDAGVVPGAPDAPFVPTANITAFRFDSIGVADPHLFVGLGSICLDVTEIVNNVATNVLQVDANEPHDGLLDGSLALVFRPFVNKPGASTTVDLEVPDCLGPALSATCRATADTARYTLTASAQGTGHCLESIPGTATDEPSPIESPCFTTDTRTIQLNFLGADITLRDARGGASYFGNKLNPGLIRGFLSKADAEALVLEVPGYGQRSIASFLFGGGSCRDNPGQPMGDMDRGPNGELGWYVYVTFTAVSTPYAEE